MQAAWPAPDTRREFWITAAVAFISSLIVFLPQLGFKGAPGGLSFNGDTLNFYVPTYGALDYFVSNGVFSGIDYFTHNGAAEWFLRPNLVAYHPLYIIFGFFTQSDTAVEQALSLILILWIHAAISVFCALRICRAFLGFDFALSAFVAVGFTFSGYLSGLLGYVTFGYVCWLMPAIIYGLLATAHRFTPARALAGSVAVVCSVLSGYLPLSMFSMGISLLFLFLFIFLFAEDDGTWRERSWKFLLGASPIIIGAVVTFFYLFAVASYAADVNDASIANNIDYSAYDLAEKPWTIFRLFSLEITFPGPIYEFSLFWGWIVVAIFVCFVARGRDQLGPISRSHGQVMAMGWGVYLFYALLIFGSATALSAIFFYFMPIIGFMHIYQRFLPMAQFFLLIATAIMLSSLIDSSNRRAEKIVLVLMVALLTWMCWLIVQNVPLAPFAFRELAIVEVIYGCAFLVALILFPRPYVIWTATILMLLVPTARVYHYVANKDLNIVGRAAMFTPLDENAAQDFDKKLQTFKGQKAITKVVDITPGIYGAVPENYPWFRLNTSRVSTYTGYDWHVGVPIPYRSRNQFGPLAGSSEQGPMPDPNWIIATGADAILYQPDAPSNNPALMAMVDNSDPSRVFQIRPGHVLAPLRTDSARGGSAADNGYFRVIQAGRAAITDFADKGGGNFDFTVSAQYAGKLEYLFWPNERLVFEVNGKRVLPEKGRNGLATISLPAGTNKLTVRYSNLSLTLFLALYAVYSVLTVIVLSGSAVMSAGRRAWREGRKLIPAKGRVTDPSAPSAEAAPAKRSSDGVVDNVLSH